MRFRTTPLLAAVLVSGLCLTAGAQAASTDAVTVDSTAALDTSFASLSSATSASSLTSLDKGHTPIPCVPEPSTGALLGVAFAVFGVAVVRKRRGSSQD